MTGSSANPSEDYISKLDTSRPHSARTWNYWLGGKDNFAIDREVGERVRQAYPLIVEVARASRAFLIRAVRYLAGEAGIRQFLDIGTGLPTADNTHEVAQRMGPESRIVYVDNDPLVLVHARALLTSSPEGATDYIDADLHDPDRILHEAARTLDFSRPIAIVLQGILGYVQDYESPATSMAWSWWNQAWSPRRSGGPSPVPPTFTSCRRPAAWGASRRPGSPPHHLTCSAVPPRRALPEPMPGRCRLTGVSACPW